jgi:hypothetical protein
MPLITESEPVGESFAAIELFPQQYSHKLTEQIVSGVRRACRCYVVNASADGFTKDAGDARAITGLCSRLLCCHSGQMQARPTPVLLQGGNPAQRAPLRRPQRTNATLDHQPANRTGRATWASGRYERQRRAWRPLWRVFPDGGRPSYQGGPNKTVPPDFRLTGFRACCRLPHGGRPPIQGGMRGSGCDGGCSRCLM